MCNKAVNNYPHLFLNAITLKKMCDKALYTNPSTMKFVPEYYKTQKMCYKAVHRCFCI